MSFVLKVLANPAKAREEAESRGLKVSSVRAEEVPEGSIPLTAVWVKEELGASCRVWRWYTDPAADGACQLVGFYEANDEVMRPL